MSSSEFSQWQEFMRVETIGPGGEVERWASLMAALANGPLRKKSKAMFTVDDYMPRRWAPPPKKRPASVRDARAFVKGLRSKGN